VITGICKGVSNEPNNQSKPRYYKPPIHVTISKNTSYILNKLLRKTIRPKREEMTGSSRNCIMRNLHSSSCKITMVKITMMMMMMIMRWVGHVACRGMHIGFWWESQKERDH
jgi:hypothetical protein